MDSADLGQLTEDEREAFAAILEGVGYGSDGDLDFSDLTSAEIIELDRILAKLGDKSFEVLLARPTPPPHERRAALHRARYHGEAVPLPAWSVKARFKLIDQIPPRVRVICGYGAPCAASLGEATGSDGVNANWAAHGLGLLEIETYGGRNVSSPGALYEWVLTAPAEFPGFERLPDGGFAVIRTRKRRTLDGSLVRRWTGRREAPNALYSGGMPLTRTGRPMIDGVAGWWARLPAVVVCPLCRRRNLVHEPPLDERTGTC